MAESHGGNLTKKQFVKLFTAEGTKGNAESIAGHLFRAFDLDESYAIGNLL